MSRRGALAALLVLTCLLLSACAQPPLTQPPAGGMMRDSWVTIKDGKVQSMSVIACVIQGMKVINYTLQEDNGVRWCAKEKDGGGTLGELLYTDFAPVLERAKADRFGLSQWDTELHISYTAKPTGTNAAVVSQLNLQRESYYVYSRQNGALIKGDGVACGNDSFGRFNVIQYQRDDVGQTVYQYTNIFIGD